MRNQVLVPKLEPEFRLSVEPNLGYFVEINRGLGFRKIGKIWTRHEDAVRFFNLISLVLKEN